MRACIQQVKTTIYFFLKLLHNKRRYELIYKELAIRLEKGGLFKCLKERKCDC